jgi:hypothetical protein
MNLSEKKMTKIDTIWNELENDKTFSQGLLIRRYSADVLPDVYVALKSPENFRCIAASLSNSLQVNLSSFSDLRDINVEITPDETNSGKKYLIFKLLNNEHKDIFSVLCEDLIISISSLKNENRLYKELLNRFEKWKSLFDKASSQGLTSDEQRGLYGELIFLRKLLQHNSDFPKVITSWIGVEKQVRDFQYGSWSVEVKTTHGNNHQKILISNERQLDTTNLDDLYLFHISLESRLHSGETLNDIIDSVILILKGDFSSLNKFKNKLLEAGYFDNHRNQYSETGYFIRNEIFYKVENEFPRIEETEIRNGVGDVKYSIIISQCSGYADTEEQVLQKVTFK